MDQSHASRNVLLIKIYNVHTPGDRRRHSTQDPWTPTDDDDGETGRSASSHGANVGWDRICVYGSLFGQGRSKLGVLLLLCCCGHSAKRCRCSVTAPGTLSDVVTRICVGVETDEALHVDDGGGVSVGLCLIRLLV